MVVWRLKELLEQGDFDNCEVYFGSGEARCKVTGVFVEHNLSMDKRAIVLRDTTKVEEGREGKN